MIFYTADPHLDHEPILGWTDRGKQFKNIDEMNQSVVKTWNATVSSKDEVRIIGDYAFKNHRRWTNELNGKKWLCIGNHDGMSLDALYDFGQLDPEVMKTLRNFRNVFTQIECSVEGLRMVMNHYWLGTWEGAYRGQTVNLHGHVHGRRQESLPRVQTGSQIWIDVGWDVFKRPVSHDELMEVVKYKRGMIR